MAPLYKLFMESLGKANNLPFEVYDPKSASIFRPNHPMRRTSKFKAHYQDLVDLLGEPTVTSDGSESSTVEWFIVWEDARDGLKWYYVIRDNASAGSQTDTTQSITWIVETDSPARADRLIQFVENNIS